jgi:hypothetical protein
MDKLIIKPEFDAKLKELRIKTKFIKYCKDPKWTFKSIGDSYRRNQNKTNVWATFIEYAFNWENTPEGFSYWSNICNK